MRKGGKTQKDYIFMNWTGKNKYIIFTKLLLKTFYIQYCYVKPNLIFSNIIQR